MADFKERLRKKGCTRVEYTFIMKNKQMLIEKGPEYCLEKLRDGDPLEESHNDILNNAKESKLSSLDYAILDIIDRGDMKSALIFETLKTAISMLKLSAHGLIKPLDRYPTFDELERLQILFDSKMYMQLQERLQKIMSDKIKKQLEDIMEIIGIKTVNQLLDITPEGKEALKIKRSETIKLYLKMKNQYADDEETFYESVEKYETEMPMLLIMGFYGNVMTYMISSSNTKYLPVGYLGSYQKTDDSKSDFSMSHLAGAGIIGLLTGGMLGTEYS